MGRPNNVLSRNQIRFHEGHKPGLEIVHPLLHPVIIFTAVLFFYTGYTLVQNSLLHMVLFCCFSHLILLVCEAFEFDLPFQRKEGMSLCDLQIPCSFSCNFFSFAIADIDETWQKKLHLFFCGEGQGNCWR